MRIQKILVIGLLACAIHLLQPVGSNLPTGMQGLVGTSEAQAFEGWGPSLGGGGSGGSGGGGGTSSAPEISGAAGLSVLALLACCLMVMRGRK